MIDTDKYEGHTPAPWSWCEDEGLDLVVADNQGRTVIEEVKALNTNADAQLIADAPLLLQALIDEQAEVKRLQERLYLAEEYIKHDTWMAYAMQVLERNLGDEE